MANGYHYFNGVDATAYAHVKDTPVTKIELNILLEDNGGNTTLFHNLSSNLQDWGYAGEYEYNVAQLYLNGEQQNLDTYEYAYGERFTVTAHLSDYYVNYGSRLFADGYAPTSTPTDFTKGRIYSAKFFNGEELVAHFDFTKETVTDIVGGYQIDVVGTTYFTTALPTRVIELQATREVSKSFTGKRTTELALNGQRTNFIELEGKING
ncbi:hypothetical protein [Gracilibacillus lacisalsi]|uniref:hypothetical protein n=1 Tax=Gracilibacillus lacisalsi TaxID=393087 RepID=UPI0003736543|nr:hypothetical protein [Gracilibacillus lacisalsi]